MSRTALIRGPLHHQVIVRIAALIAIAENLVTLIGFSTGWELRFLCWDAERQCRKKTARD